MAFYHIFFIISVLQFMFCPCGANKVVENVAGDMESPTYAKRCKNLANASYSEKGVLVPKYAIYLIGITIILMLIAIIVLSIALYCARKKRSTLDVSDSQKYVRQESATVAPLYNSNYDEQNKNNGSTLTVNSGIIQISEPRISEPETPTRVEDSKIVFTRKPIQQIVPVVPRGQMDAICKEVLKRVQKSDSASFRDLNELMLNVNEKKDEKDKEICETVNEVENEKKTEDKDKQKDELKIDLPRLKPPESNITPELLSKLNARCQQLENEVKDDMKNEVKEESPVEKLNKHNDKSKSDVNSDIHIEIDYVKNMEDSGSSDTEYDTVPTPIRFRHSGPEPDMTEDIPVYDLPPRRSHDGHNGNIIQYDQDSEYFVPLSAENTDSCYVNAKRNTFNNL